MADWKGSHHHWVLARPLEAGGARPPLIEDRHLPHKISPGRAKIQERSPVSKASWGRIVSQDPEHRPQRFGRQILLLEPHAVFVPRKGPHLTGVVLERSNATLMELLHHLGRRHIKRPQTLEATPDEGEPGACEHLMIPA